MPGSGAPERIEARLRQWDADGFVARILSHDPTLWAPRGTPEIEDRLGWLDLPSRMTDKIGDLMAFGKLVAAEGVRDVVVLGMGGSSLAPEVFQTTFGNTPGHPRLSVLDSTHPQAVTALAAKLDLPRTLFVVSSKSGTTTETLSFLNYFWHRLTAAGIEPGTRFVAITDPDTPLERLAREREFRRVFPAPPDVGGRYSALCEFGLVPAALIGLDLDRLIGWVSSVGDATAEETHQSLRLGATMGECAVAGRYKVTFITSASLSSLPAWIEQLIAESTGKGGVGILPIDQEPLVDYDNWGDDRLFAYIGLRNETDSSMLQSLRARVPEWAYIEQIIDDRYEISRLMMRWEVATAAAGAVLRINPFDQPDVQLAKDLAREAMSGSAGAAGVAGRIASVDDADLESSVSDWYQAASQGDYIGIHVYLAPDDSVWNSVQRLRAAMGKRIGVTTTAGYGPRFLHSTGQLHKGGVPSGLFLQILDNTTENDVSVPETNYTFGQLIAAQAAGDAGALIQRERRVLRVNLGNDARRGFERLISLFE